MEIAVELKKQICHRQAIVELIVATSFSRNPVVILLTIILLKKDLAGIP